MTYDFCEGIMTEYKIGIAGAGIGGLAAAALLAQSGCDVTVFDQFDAPQPVGSGLVIQPVGLGVLDQIGAGAAARQKGNAIARMIGHDRVSGLRVLDVAYAHKPGGRNGLAIHRASLFQAILDAAIAAGITLRPSARVSAAPLDGRRRITLETGEDAGAFDLVVDATGARSPLSPLKGRALSYGAIWGAVPWSGDTPLPKDQLTQQYHRASQMAGIMPMGTLPDSDKQLAAIFWSLPTKTYDAWRAAPLEDWKAQACDLWPDYAPFVGAIRSHDDMTFAQYTHGTLAKPSAERLAYLGDAAHRASPQLGQGANMALLDAAALAQAVRSHGPEEAPAEYARLRRWHVRAYQLLSAVFTPQYQSDSRALPLLRDRVLMPVSRVPPVPRILTRLVCGDIIPPLRGAPREVPDLRAEPAE